MQAIQERARRGQVETSFSEEGTQDRAAVGGRAAAQGGVRAAHDALDGNHVQDPDELRELRGKSVREGLFGLFKELPNVVDQVEQAASPSGSGKGTSGSRESTIFPSLKRTPSRTNRTNSGAWIRCYRA